MDFNDYAESLAYDTAFWMYGFNEDNWSIEELGHASIEVTDKLRALAIIALITTADHNVYCHNLIRSGLVRERFLSRCRRSNRTDVHHYVSGRYLPFMDAVAAGAFDIARRIVTLSPHEWREGHEYEDDFCFSQICHQFVDGSGSRESYEELATRFEAATDGEDNARLEICRSWIDSDAAAFSSAFEMLLEEREESIEKDLARGQLEDAVVCAQRHVFVEGLAILRLTESMRMNIQAVYRYCPDMARLPMSRPFEGELFDS